MLNLKIDKMKTYKLIGLDYYTVAFSLEDAVMVFLANRIGVTINDIEVSDIEPAEEALGKVLRSREELDALNYID